MTRSAVYRAGVELLRSAQEANGAWLASPTFSTYYYSWFRDGAFMAHAMAVAGHPQAAEAFHRWAFSIVAERRDQLSRAISVARRGEPVPEDLVLHTRYRADGSEGSVDWENHQLDGAGTWLWALASFRGDDRLPEHERGIVDQLADYLSVMWQRPCYDLWEEFGDGRHTYTLAAVWAGLGAAERLSGNSRHAERREIVAFVRERLTRQGRLIKALDDDRVDASLVGAIVPYGLLQPDEPVARSTVNALRAELLREGGVHRYRDDTYYGGGAWPLLSAWLGWYHARLGDRERARELLEWVESQAHSDTHLLPEQVASRLNDPTMLDPWILKWGPSADPLLWSHAMHIILCHALDGQP